VRYAILSDIHGNLEALTAVLADVDARGADQLICLGDIVGYGPSPNECCDLLRGRSCLAIAGNHDEAAVAEGAADGFNALAAQAILWTRTVLTAENRAYLDRLPRELSFESFAVVHGAPESHFDYILGVRDAQAAFERVHKPVTFFGHTHVAEVFFQETAQAHGERRASPAGPQPTFHQRLVRGGRIQVSPRFRYLVNPGSVGQPRDGNPAAAFAYFDDETGVIELVRVTYDVDGVRARMADVHLPPQLGQRLSLGY
jgi:predicted phosphodiesterase